ncbi:STAS domain-containing protein [Streptomyces canus]|uniref:STAS domain-containing protein n=1 Tax=Streptomyces canus TaxID=58343 RepID=UPI00131A44B8|nr:STAS domain-containing protein [Streptomyces canus]
MADLSVVTVASGRCLVARVSGDMDHVNDQWFRAQFKELIARGGRFIVLDLAGVSFCDSAGLNVLIGSWRRADAGGCGRGCAGAGVCAPVVAADPSDDRGGSAAAGL